jgi:hypothetical protein
MNSGRRWRRRLNRHGFAPSFVEGCESLKTLAESGNAGFHCEPHPAYKAQAFMALSFFPCACSAKGRGNSGKLSPDDIEF